MELPVFVYRPDPISTGQVVRADTQCVVCQQSRGFVYVGPTYSQEEIDEDSICPWCIADGSAHERFDVEFTDFALIGVGLIGTGPVSDEIIEEIAYGLLDSPAGRESAGLRTAVTAAHSLAQSDALSWSGLGWTPLLPFDTPRAWKESSGSGSYQRSTRRAHRPHTFSAVGIAVSSAATQMRTKPDPVCDVDETCWTPNNDEAYARACSRLGSNS